MGTAAAGIVLPLGVHGKERRRVVTIVFITVFLDLLGFGILIPIQPFLALSFGARPAVITWLAASYSLMQFLFTPFWGRISDRFGRRPVMIVSNAASAIGFFLFAYAESMTWLFASRIISGFGAANIGCAQAIMADITSRDDRTKGMGLISAAMGLGFIVGPVIGGVLGQNGFLAPALASGLLSFANLILIFWLLKETRVRDSAGSKARANLCPPSERGNMALLYALSFMIIMGFSLFEQSLGMFIDSLTRALLDLPVDGDGFSLSVKRTAGFLAAIAIISASFQLTMLEKLSKAMGEQRLLVIGSLLSAISLAFLPMIAQSFGFWWMLMPASLFAVGFSVCLPGIVSLISQIASTEQQGAALGRSQSCSALGRVVGPMCCGVLFEISSSLPLFVGALALGVSA